MKYKRNFGILTPRPESPSFHTTPNFPNMPDFYGNPTWVEEKMEEMRYDEDQKQCDEYKRPENVAARKKATTKRAKAEKRAALVRADRERRV
jgi:hypothetical protein